MEIQKRPGLRRAAFEKGGINLVDLDPNRISELLHPGQVRVCVHSEIDSTSSECRRLLAEGETCCLVAAESQSAGRGRQGKSFFSPAGRGLYMSLLFAPAGGIPATDGFTSYAAVAVRRAVCEICGIDCGIKWVNDLYVGGKKVCGILSEAVGKSLIVGIGVDLIPGEVPAELTDIVGALGCSCDRNALCAAIANRLLAWTPGDRQFLEEYREASVVLGRTIRFLHRGIQTQGLADALNEDGSLAVKTSEGRVNLSSGEITLLAYDA